jgi:hypothetical protein
MRISIMLALRIKYVRRTSSSVEVLVRNRFSNFDFLLETSFSTVGAGEDAAEMPVPSGAEEETEIARPLLRHAIVCE